MKSFLLLFLMIGGTAMAQTMKGNAQGSSDVDVSDKEVDQFVSAFQSAQSVQQEMQQKMMSSIKDKGMTVEEFTKMRKESMDPEKDMSGSADKQKKFKQVKGEIEKIQPKMQKKVESAIEESGLTMKRYQAIASAVRSDQSLQQKIQKKMAAQQAGGMQGGGGM